MADKASSAPIDFTNVKEGGGTFNKKRQPVGDYKGTITSVVDAPSKKDNINQWLFTIQVGTGTYPYYCKHQENQYWKIRDILVACGLNVPKKKVNVDPNKCVGRNIAITLDDDEYDGKAQSQIAATFPLSQLEDAQVPAEADDEDDADDEDETPAPAKKKKAPEPEPEDDDDEDDEPAPPPAKKKKAPAPVEEEDDDDVEDEAPAPPVAKKKKSAPAPVEDDDDLEEIDIDD